MSEARPRRLTIGRALAWVSLLFLIPLVVLMGLIVSGSWSDIQQAQKEARGVDYLVQIWPAMTAMDRDLGPTEPAFDLEFGTSETALDFMRATAVDTRFRTGAQLIADVSDGAGLTLDPELAGDHLIDAVTVKLPGLINAATELNEAAQIRDADQASRLAVALDHLQAASDQAQAALDGAMKYDASGVAHSVLYPHVAGLAGATRDLIAKGQAVTGGGDPNAVSQGQAALQRQIDGAWRASQAQLDRQIQARITRLTERLAAELALVLALLIVAGAVTAKIAGGLRRRLLDLAEVGEQLVANQVFIDVPDVDAGGEIGRLALALAGLKSELIERNLQRFDAGDRHREVEAKLDAAQATIAAAQAERRVAIEALGSAIKKLGQGDLTTQVQADLAADFETLKTDFNAAAAVLRDTLVGVIGEAEGMAQEIETLIATADDLTRRNSEQSAGLDTAASGLGALSEAAQESLAEARRANAMVGAAKGEAAQGDAIVRQAAGAMEQIAGLAQQITQIVSVMDEIAFQTNLLALNAGVEAARSGEAGRGFAVVAQEVRALAQRSAVAAKDIRALISASTQQVGSGVSLVGQTSEALGRILAQVAEVDGLVSALAKAGEGQVGALKQVGGAVGQADQATRQGAAGVSQALAAARALRLHAAELSAWIEGVRLNPPVRAPQRFAAPPPSASPSRGAPVIQLRDARAPSAPRRAAPEPQFLRRLDRDDD